jgi:hypothetical protein
LKTVVEDAIAHVDEAFADGKLSTAEVWGFIMDIVPKSMKVVAHLADEDDAHKRQAVVDAAVFVWEEKLKPMDGPGPDALVDPFVSGALPYAVGAMYDTLTAWKKDED